MVWRVASGLPSWTVAMLPALCDTRDQKSNYSVALAS